MSTGWDMRLVNNCIHVFPDATHEFDMNCWCAPDLETLCPQCHGSDTGCWRCDGYGMITGSALDPRRVEKVNHRDFDADTR